MNIAELVRKLSPTFKDTRADDCALQIQRLEQAFYSPVPADYSQFLLSDGRAVAFGTNRIALPDDREKRAFSLDLLYGVDDYDINVLNQNRVYEGRLPPGLITIGTSGADDQICLDVSGLSPGAVYYWDHERECDQSGLKRPDYSNLTLLARSFTNLIERTSLVPEISNKPGDVIRATFRFKLPGRD